AYDHGCDLVEAARALRAEAGDPEVAPGGPAVIGCLEAALRDLAEAGRELERSLSEATGGQPDGAGARRAARMRQGMANLEVALRDAADAAAAARALAARALGEPRGAQPT